MPRKCKQIFIPSRPPIRWTFFGNKPHKTCPGYKKTGMLRLDLIPMNYGRERYNALERKKVISNEKQGRGHWGLSSTSTTARGHDWPWPRGLTADVYGDFCVYSQYTFSKFTLHTNCLTEYFVITDIIRVNNCIVRAVSVECIGVKLNLGVN